MKEETKEAFKAKPLKTLEVRVNHSKLLAIPFKTAVSSKKYMICQFSLKITELWIRQR